MPYINKLLNFFSGSKMNLQISFNGESTSTSTRMTTYKLPLSIQSQTNIFSTKNRERFTFFRLTLSTAKQKSKMDCEGQRRKQLEQKTIRLRHYFLPRRSLKTETAFFAVAFLLMTAASASQISTENSSDQSAGKISSSSSFNEKEK